MKILVIVVAFTAGVWFGFFLAACCTVASEKRKPSSPVSELSEMLWVKENE